ncbi:hypothetical protein HYH02_011862 [Chlamydomonas schloesseri]|uniref:CBM21 domain-containing protein n=1 Tax=Chlamydomonas schloesseri TaxID=2026947 RepID=A0A835W364_9CHLO|nr:hypothetical protein HYH02_011862 [Chlamydomonas schloesseri]|eukprot:KAG2435568.1 hypothetical protein HYH02_011862 [Chlamydomonas schloesseri]
MLKSLFGHGHAGGEQQAKDRGGPARDGGLLFSTDSKVELREVSAAGLDRVLSRGAMELRACGGGGGAAAWLQVGSTELPLAGGGGAGPGGGAGGGVGASKQAPLFHRIDARTFRLHLAGGATSQARAAHGAGAALDGGVTGAADGGGDGNGNGNSGAESPGLLLLFPANAPDHDVNTCAAVLSDLAAGRGAAEPAGVAAYSPRGSGPNSPAHSRGGGGSSTGGASPSTDSQRVLFHDSDPARNLGFKGSQPVRLTHMERIPPPSLRQQHQQLQLQHQGPQGGSSGSGSSGRGSLAADSGVAGPAAAVARSLLGPRGGEVGSPGGTRAGRLQGLGLGSVWGSVAVANLAYEKDVRVRYSLDGWSSWGEVSANWDKRLGLGADNFNFLIDLDAAAAANGVCVRNTLAAGQHVTLSLAVHYLAAGQEHWDNNEGGNYTFDLPCE